MLALWICVAVTFWIVYYQFTRGGLTRHLGFLHFAFYFFAIYGDSYRQYVAGGSHNDRFLLSVMAFPVLSMVGMLFAQWFGWRTLFHDRALRLDRKEVWLVVAVVAFFLSLYAVYLKSLGSSIPLLGLLRGGEAQASRLARYLATKGYEAQGAGGLRFFYWLPRILIEYFASFVVVFAFLWARARHRGYLRFALVFVALAFVALLDVQKHPAVKLVAVLALCVFNLRHARLRLRSFVLIPWLALAAVFGAGVVYNLASGNYRSLSGSPVQKVITTGELGYEMLMTRGFVGQAQPLYVIYDIIPRVYPYFGGRTLTNPRGLLPYRNVPLNYLVYDYYNSSDPGVQGSDPTVFFGEFYANWGIGMSLVAMLLFGVVVQGLHHTLARDIEMGGTAFDVAFFYMIMVYIADFALSFSTIYFDERMWFFLALYWIRRWLVAKPVGSVMPTSAVHTGVA